MAQNSTQFLEGLCARDEIVSLNRDPSVSILVVVLSDPSELFRAIDIPLGDLGGFGEASSLSRLGKTIQVLAHLEA